MKTSVSTSLEEEVSARVDILAARTLTSSAAILRRCVVAGLPGLEREILGEQFAGKPLNGNARRQTVKRKAA